MTNFFRLCGLMALVVTAPMLGSAAQTPQKPNSSRESDVTAVLVDVVVRDRAGQPVADLKPEEFQIYEDGSLQAPGSFTPIFRDQSPAGASRAPGTVLPSTAAAGAGAPAQ